ncbi:Slp family lipoprotein [Methylophaga sp.]|uniref:Slp family lipoprotein n=1 Tax=Methylophaga sp. TaxID=2024840 RepID=UPI0026013202|nr:Slp family lipoprotein [Methylophaga sp.]
MKQLSAFFVTSFVLVLLSGCSNIPKQITTAPSNDLQLNEIQGKIENFANQDVRWGGELVNVENNNDASIMQIVQYPLNHYGKPITNQSSDGRFLAKTTEFIDPVVYKKGTLLTFTGTLNGEDSRKVDQKELIMPVLDVSSMYKWQPYQPIQLDPFYDPFFYNGFYPYHGYHNRYWHYPRFGYPYYYW